jgi:four helix bundle protein
MVLPRAARLIVGMAFVFEDLRVYQRAEECLALAYEAAALLPAAERFNLSEQIRRASLSVALNIAESTERRSNRDAARFLQFALGSLVEVVACLRIIEKRAYGVPPQLLASTRDQYENLYRQLHAYRRALRTRD